MLGTPGERRVPIQARGPLSLRETDGGPPCPRCPPELCVCPSLAPCRPGHTCRVQAPRPPPFSAGHSTFCGRTSWSQAQDRPLKGRASAVGPPGQPGVLSTRGMPCPQRSPPGLRTFLGWVTALGRGHAARGPLGHNPPHLLPSAFSSVKGGAARIPEMGTWRPLNSDKTPHKWGRGSAHSHGLRCAPTRKTLLPHLGHSPPIPSAKPGFRPQYSGLRASPTARRASLPLSLLSAQPLGLACSRWAGVSTLWARHSPSLSPAMPGPRPRSLS